MWKFGNWWFVFRFTEAYFVMILSIVHFFSFLGQYSCLALTIYLQRNIGFHLVQTYLPTFLFVVVSWLSFWMDVEQVTPRIVLGITTLIIISSKSAVLGAESPQVSYIRVSVHVYQEFLSSNTKNWIPGHWHMDGDLQCFCLCRTNWVPCGQLCFKKIKEGFYQNVGNVHTMFFFSLLIF